tara:strand:+ start:2797 stop:4158 length:1362 start_codon:yes stop_codon:yes gene_type:complete
MDDWLTVILAGGRGERMQSSLPKVMHKICGKEIIRHVLDNVYELHTGSIILVVSPEDSSTIHEVIDKDCIFISQDIPLGTAHALQQVKDNLPMDNKNLIVIYGDNVLDDRNLITSVMKQHIDKNSDITLLTKNLDNPEGYGRIIKNDSGDIIGIVEQRDLLPEQESINEISGGIYCFRIDWLKDNLDKVAQSKITKEFYLTELIAIAHGQGHHIDSYLDTSSIEIMGVNNKLELSIAEKIIQKKILNNLMINGITIKDPYTTYIDSDVKLGKDSIILANTHLCGRSIFGERSTIGPNSIIRDTIVGDDCKIVNSFVEKSELKNKVSIGPFSHIRPDCILHTNVHIGNYVETKNSDIGENTKIGHFGYIGDSKIGMNVNIGAGTITCNYDGKEKHTTTIQDGSFIGSDTMLIAPVNIGQNVITGAGSVVNRDVPNNSKVIGAPAKIINNRGKKL